MTRIVRRGAIRALAFMALAFLAGHAAPVVAMGVTPVHIEMTSSGGRGQVTVTNDGSTPLPVEPVVQKLALDESGESSLTAAGDDFLVFPAQAMIPAGGTQVFRIQWVGEPMLSESQSFIVSFNQVPVKLVEGESGTQVVMSLGVMVNVAPPGSVPDLRVVATSVANGKGGKRYPAITVENSSKTHALLSEASIALSSGGWTEAMSDAQVRNKIGIGLVQPGKRRRFVIPIELPAGVSKVEANIDFKPKKR